MELVSISLYTIDTKGGKILEINDGVNSGIKPLDAAYNGDFIKNVIAPEIQAQFPDREVVYFYPGDNLGEVVIHALENAPPNWNPIILSGYSRDGSVGDEYLENHPATLTNAARADLAAFNNKGLVFDLATRLNLQTIPQTAHFQISQNAEDIEKIANKVKAVFEDSNYVVIKPTNAGRGEGVVIIPKDRIAEELNYLFKLSSNKKIEKRYGDHGFAEQWWKKRNSAEPTLLEIQSFTEDNHINFRGKEWDGTRRFVCTTIIQKDEMGQFHAETKAYGGLIKLPREAVHADGSLDLPSRISFSHAHGPLDTLGNLFSNMTGRGAKIILTEDQVAENTRQIAQDLNRLFLALHTMDIPAYINSLKSSADPAQRILGHQIARVMLQEPVENVYTELRQKELELAHS